MAFELRDRLQHLLEIPLSNTLAFDYPNIDVLVKYLGNLIHIFPEQAQERQVDVDNLTQNILAVDSMTREQLIETLRKFNDEEI